MGAWWDKWFSHRQSMKDKNNEQKMHHDEQKWGAFNSAYANGMDPRSGYINAWGGFAGGITSSAAQAAMAYFTGGTSLMGGGGSGGGGDFMSGLFGGGESGVKWWDGMSTGEKFTGIAVLLFILKLLFGGRK